MNIGQSIMILKIDVDVLLLNIPMRQFFKSMTAKLVPTRTMYQAYVRLVLRFFY